MDQREHIHIISAGDGIHKTYPAVLSELRTVTHTFVFAEKEVYTNSARDDTRKRIWKCTIRDAIDTVNTISLSRGISCSLACIDTATFEQVRDAVLGIFSDHPDARFSFDISAGSKRLSMGLFSLSLWIEGDSYYAFGNSPVRMVPVPTLPIKNLPAHPHYFVILIILFRGMEQGKKTRTLVPKETLFSETKAWHIPVRDTVDNPADRELSLTDFLRLLANLIAWNLIREETGGGTVQDTLYSITPQGELALCVYSARMKKRGVASPDGIT
jgi:hypothetical protein